MRGGKYEEKTDEKKKTECGGKMGAGAEMIKKSSGLWNFCDLGKSDGNTEIKRNGYSQKKKYAQEMNKWCEQEQIEIVISAGRLLLK